MFIDVNSIGIKTASMNDYVYLGNYIVEVKYGYHKLWGPDSGRNLAGKQVGTLIGIFPKLTIQFRKLNKNELELLAPILDSASQIVRYYDLNKKAYVTMETYTGDYEIVNKNIISNTVRNEGFSCSFIAREKRA